MKIYLDTVGCRLNQSEIESIGRQFRAAGHEIIPSADGADMAVVNTCAVTAQAASDSRGVVRRIARTGVRDIVVTGCWATLQPQQAAGLPSVRRVIDNNAKDGLVADLLDLPGDALEQEPIVRRPLPGMRRRTRAFIKVQDGCNNRCTFCVTTLARGSSRSRPLANVISDIQFALDGGAKEVVLTGVHLGSWGQDFGAHLHQLVKAILHETDVQRLRLSSLEPWDLDPDFFALWGDTRLCRHLHLPLQSGCAATLKRMARKTTPDSFHHLLEAARSVMQDVAITTDIIAGFPGETEDEFRESLDFVAAMNFAGGHAFSYSPRPGTGAARMSAQVPPDVTKQRNALYRLALERSGKAYYRRFLGQQMTVLWESTTQLNDNGWQLAGLTGNYLRVEAAARQPMWNEISQVVLESAQGESMLGTIVT
jgi:threonylcarbamoyladenosine tRNA methylthiotransferase MtaB